RFTVANGRYRELVGRRDVVGKTLAEALPELAGQGFDKLLDGVRASGTPYVAHEALVRLDRRGNGVLEDVFVDFVYQPLRDAAGAVFGIMAHAVDTSEQVFARRRIEALAAEREAMLSQIADGIITYDRDGRIAFANDAARALMPALEVGKTVADQRAHVPILQLDGTMFPPGESPSGRARRGERVLDVEWLSGPADGERRRLQGSAVPVVDRTGAQIGVVVTCRDVTERHRLSAQLEFERNRLDHVFQQAPAAIMVCRGRDHRIEAANPFYARMTGDRPLVGKSLREALPDLAGQGLFELYDEVLATQKPYVGNEVPVRIDRFGRSEEAYFNFVYQPLIDHTGLAFGVMTHAVEVTDVVRARRHAEERAAELVRLTGALEQSNRELDQFAYVASHDLKAPLRGIANLAQWIHDDSGDRLSAQSLEHVELLFGRVQRMESLIDGILMYSRAGRTREPITAVDTAALVAE
ncbi:MAG: PAS domain-containing protein, partial [Myxococcales bacterium]|nr:PAS domain-containing protein [Myxococcales bacterium]